MARTNPKKIVSRRSPGRFREREVARVMRAAARSAMPVREITVDPSTGKITIVVGDAAKTEAANPWNEVLTNTC